MTVPLTRLRADNPLAYLVTLGILGLLADDDPDTTLTWEPDGPLHQPVFRSGLATTHEQLVDYLTGRLDPEKKLVETWLTFTAKDINALTIAELDERLRTITNLTEERVVASIAAEIPIKPPRTRRADANTVRDSTVVRTPFCMAMFNISSGFLQSARRQARNITRTEIEECVEWRHRRGINTLNLDPSARAQVRALMAQEPMTAQPSGVPAAIPLAIRGLAFYPLAPRRTTTTAPNFTDAGFRWPIWNTPLNATAVQLLTTAPFLQHPIPAQLRSHHVKAIYEAATEQFHVQKQPLRRFKWGKRIA